MYLDGNTDHFKRRPTNPKRLTPEEQWALIRNWQNSGCQKSAKKLLDRFDKKITRVAKLSGLDDLEEKIQVGKFGFVKAINKFDFIYGTVLSTYAERWVRAEIANYLEKAPSVVRRDRVVRRKEKTAIEDLHTAGKWDVTCNDVAIDAPIHFDDGEASLHESICDDLFEDNAFAEGAPQSQIDALHDVVKTLDDRSRRIFEARNLNETPNTLGGLGAQYNISRERVRQIENRTFDKVRAATKSRADLPAAAAPKNRTKWAFGCERYFPRPDPLTQLAPGYETVLAGSGNRLSRSALRSPEDFDAMNMRIAPYAGRFRIDQLDDEYWVFGWFARLHNRTFKLAEMRA
jgi:RNA polymerase sigma-32 factor